MLPPPSARAFQGSAPSTGTHTSASLLPSPPLPVQPFSHCHPSQDAQAEPKAAKSRGKLNQQRFLIQPGSLVARVRGGVCSELLGFPLIFPWARHGAREAEGDHEGRAQHPTHPPPPPPHPPPPLPHPPTPGCLSEEAPTLAPPCWGRALGSATDTLRDLGGLLPEPTSHHFLSQWAVQSSARKCHSR